MSTIRKKVFVTGGRGRLAVLIKQRLDPNKYDIKLFSRTSDNDFENINRLTDVDYLSQADFLLHLAWSNYPFNSDQSTQPWNKSSDYLILNDLLQSVEISTNTKFVFFSSCAVYGNTFGSRPVEEDSPFLHPLSWYSRTKLMAENLVARLPSYLNLRISNPYGNPAQINIDSPQGIVPKIIKAAMSGESLKLWGDGSAKKDFLYFTDFINALDHMLSFNLRGTYNICRGCSNSINEVIRIVETAMDKKIQVEHLPSARWDVTDNRVSNQKASSHACWIPYVDISDGITKTLNDMKLFST